MPEVIHELTDALQSATESGTPLLVTGEPGNGMTTALAAFTVRFKEQLHKIHGQQTALIFTHFVGNSANFSTDLRRLLHRMCSEFDDYFDVSRIFLLELLGLFIYCIFMSRYLCVAAGHGDSKNFGAPETLSRKVFGQGRQCGEGKK